MFKQTLFGTHGRIWHTDEENNIAFSFFIETNCKVENLNGVTIEIANSIIKSFKLLYNITLEIKYPNDIVFKGKKIGGILTESKIQGKIAKYLVIGIGINTNQEKFADEIKEIATSIKNEFKLNIDNEKVINKFYEIFEEKLIQEYNIQNLKRRE